MLVLDQPVIRIPCAPERRGQEHGSGGVAGIMESGVGRRLPSAAPPTRDSRTYAGRALHRVGDRDPARPLNENSRAGIRWRGCRLRTPARRQPPLPGDPVQTATLDDGLAPK